MKWEKWNYVIAGAWVFGIIALGMTIFELAKETIFHDELTMWQSHAITIFFTSLLGTVVFVMLNRWFMSLAATYTAISVKKEKLRALELTCQAVYHIVNNFLNSFQLIKLQADSPEGVKAETLKLLDESALKVQRQLKILEGIEDPANTRSYDDIYP